MGRSAEMVAALVGTLKAGCTYVPIDPAYPAARRAQILEDAAVPVVLTERDLASHLPEMRGRLVCVDDLPGDGGARPGDARGTPAWPDQLAYILYTSGSTGRPKGVALEHRSAVARVAWALEEYSPEDLAGVLGSTSISFDLSIFEIFVPLSCGGCVILAEDALALTTLPDRERVTTVVSVPSVMAELLGAGPLPKSVRAVNLGGERLTNALAQQLHNQGTLQRIYNLYGPSEDTTYSTYYLTAKGAVGDPPIGRPLAGTRVYILDRHLEPVAIGVTGEVFLGRRRPGPRLHRSSRTDRRVLPPESLRAGPTLQDRRPGSLPAGRADRFRGSGRQAIEAARIPDRGGRD